MAGIEPALPSGTRRPMPRGGNQPLHPLPTPPFVRTRARNARRRSPCEATRAAGPGVSARTRHDGRETWINSFRNELRASVAAAEGFEPSSAGPKPAVLPLDDAAVEVGRGVEPR